MKRSAPATRESAGRRLRALLELPHPWAILVVLLATALFGLLATGGDPDGGRFSLLLLGMLGGQLAIGALNEYQDRALDALSKPRRPIPSGLVTPGTALALVGLGLLLMLVAGAMLGLASLSLLVLGTGAGLIYDLWLKRTRWSWLPYLIALPLLPVWVWVSLARFEPRLLLIYPLGAPMVLAIHLAQSLPDAESDQRAGVRSMITRLRRERAFLIANLVALLSAAVVGLAAILLTDRPLPALAASATVALVVVSTLLLRRKGWAGEPSLIDRQLFKIMTLLAVILGGGWILSAVR